NSLTQCSTGFAKALTDRRASRWFGKSRADHRSCVFVIPSGVERCLTVKDERCLDFARHDSSSEREKQMNILRSLADTFANKPIDWDELEHALIRADLGVPMTQRIINRLQEREAWSLLGIKDVVKVAREEITRILPDSAAPIRALAGKPSVILIVGVNGTGKTTSTAKLAHLLMLADGRVRPDGGQDRHHVLLVAADTFRAAAIEQLGIWAARLGLEMVRGQYGADPAALCYDAYQKAA